MSASAPGKRLYIKTYGCQMNVYDSERMADLLRRTFRSNINVEIDLAREIHAHLDLEAE